MNVVLMTAWLSAAFHWGLQLWQVLGVLWLWWLLWLPCNVWRDYLAAMNIDRMKHGGTVRLPADPDEWCNEPDGEWIVKWVLWLPGAAKNLTLAYLACIFYFGKLPNPRTDVGVTKMLVRLSADPRIGAHVKRIQRRWLNRYDRRGFHV